MINILIVGGSSYIGCALAMYLKKEYPNQYQIDFISVRNECWRQADFTSYDSIIYLAAIVHKKESPALEHLYYKVNSDLAYEVGVKAKNSGVSQFIYFSTMAVFGVNGTMVSSESQRCKTIIRHDTPLKPITFYGKSKLQAEVKLRELLRNDVSGFNLCILRPPMVYGPPIDFYENSDDIGNNGLKRTIDCPGNYTHLRALLLKYKVFPNFSNQRSMIYIGNLCEFLRIIIQEKCSGTFYPQNQTYVCTSDMAQLICEINGFRLKKLSLPKGLLRLSSHMNGSINKLLGDLVYDHNLSLLENCCEEGPSMDYQRFEFEESMIATEQRLRT